MRETQLLLFAVSVSLLLHVTVIFAFISVPLTEAPKPRPVLVQLGLVASNPLQFEAESDEPLNDPPPEDTAPVVLESEDELEALPFETEQEDLPPISAPTSLVDIPQVEINSMDDEQERLADSELRLPSIVTVRETIQSLRAESATRYWNSDCNLMEEESEIRDCAPKDQTNYALLERNHSYEALNPLKNFDRTQRTLSTVTSEAPALAARLSSAELPGGLSDYVMQEIEAGITHLSNPGNRSVQHMGTMTDTSAAAEQARRVLGDPWVRTQANKLYQRDVHAN